jgi:streptogramin lyase
MSIPIRVLLWGALLLAAPRLVGQTILEYSIPTAGSEPFELTAGPDGAIWFTEGEGPGGTTVRVGRVTLDGTVTELELSDGSSVGLRGITNGPDGNLWIVHAFANKIGRLTTEGILTLFPIPTPFSGSIDITTGSDGALWFTESLGSKIGRISTDGVLTEYPVPGSSVQGPFRITAGSDGALWFVTASEEGAPGIQASRSIGRIDTHGVVTEFPVPPFFGFFGGITTGPEGNLWFTQSNESRVGRMTTSGAVTLFSLPLPNSAPGDIVLGPDGNLWFTEDLGNRIGRLTPAGVLTEYTVPTPSSRPGGIASGPDGNVWFTEIAGNKIGRLVLAPRVTSSSPLPPAQPGVPYSLSLQATGGISPYAWSVQSGQLPPGLTLSTDGQITGTPLLSGIFEFTVRVTDTLSATADASFRLQVGGGVGIPTLTEVSFLLLAVLLAGVGVLLLKSS